MKYLFLAIALVACLAPAVRAQSDISATIVDTTGTTLPGANAILLRTSDSLLTSFGTTDDKGQFLMEGVPVGDYFLRVSFLGYERPDMPVAVGQDDQFLGLGELQLYPAGFLLSGVEVRADRIPIRMKGDTMMYDADAFAVGSNASVEDLLRRLPGMSIDANGQITWRGKVVQEVMINGKPFFAGNSTLVTQNLDAKALKNVEVYDQKTDAEEVSGVDDGEENTTVNLEMKEEFKAKVFGELYGGYGSQERYDAGAKVFRISDASQLGALATINNVNRVGFTGDELASFNGNMGRGRWNRGGGQGGLPFYNGGQTPGQNQTLAAGLNWGRSLGKNGQLTLGYSLFDRSQTQAFTLEQAFNRRGDERTTTTLQTDNSESYNHSFTVDARQKIDSTGRFRLGGALSLTGGTDASNAETTVNGETYTVNQLLDREGPNGNLRASYDLNLGKPGKTFGVSASGNFRNDQADENILTRELTEELAIPGALINGLQVQDRETDSYAFDGQVRYENPFGDKWRVRGEVAGGLDHSIGTYRFNFEEDRVVNDLDRGFDGGTAEISAIYSWNPGSTLSIGPRLSYRTLSLTGDVNRQDDYARLFPNINLRARTKKGFYLFSLDGSQEAPSITQLQTIAQPGTSGRVTVGNIDLTPSNIYNFRSYFWFNDQFRVVSLNASLTGAYTDNAFGNELTFTRGQQIYRTVNVSHAWRNNLNLGATVGFSAINGQVHAALNGGRSIGQGFVDGNSQTNITTNYSAWIDATTELNEQSFVKVGYTYASNTNSFEDEDDTEIQTITHDIVGQFELEVSPKWRFESQLLYRIFEAAAFTGDQTIPDLRASLEVRPFKTADQEFRFSVKDIFDQNTIVNRQAQAFVTSETTSDGLGLYFLGPFHYRL